MVAEPNRQPILFPGPRAHAQRRAHILIRVSGQEQVDGYGPDVQEAECRKYAEAEGFTVAQVHTEVVSGAARFEDRPALTTLRVALEVGQVDAVIVHRINRHSRAGGEFTIQLAKECAAYGAELHYVTGDLRGKIDVSSQAVKLLLFIFGEQAATERRVMLEQLRGGVHARVAHGFPLAAGKRAPYGYQWVDGTKTDERTGREVHAPKARCEIVEHEAAIVRYIYHLALTGHAIRTFMKQLNADGVPSAEGGVWGHATVGRILRAPKYKGEGAAFAYPQRYARVGGKRVCIGTRSPDEAVPLPGVYPAIVSEEEWASVAERLRYNKSAALDGREGRRPDPEDALLRGGHVFCAICGNRMYTRHHALKSNPRPSEKRRSCYECQKNVYNAPRHEVQQAGYPVVSAATLDDGAWMMVRTLCTDSEAVAKRVLEQRGPDIAALEADVKHWQERIEELLGEERGWLQTGALAADERQRDEVRGMLALTAQQRQQAEEALLSASDALDRQRGVAERLDEGIALLRRLGEHLDTATFAEKRELIYLLNVRALVWPKGYGSARWVIRADIPDQHGATGQALVWHAKGGKPDEITRRIAHEWARFGEAEGTEGDVGGTQVRFASWEKTDSDHT